MNKKNNSKEMKTVVETFLMEETVELTYDQEKLDKWNGLVEELGLLGQEKIVEPNKSPVPFKYMDETLYNVAETLCPSKIQLKLYDQMPIPLEIMELVAMSIRENYFTEIEVWSDSKDKDPFVIGILEEYYVRDSSWNKVDEMTFKTRKSAEEHLETYKDITYVVSQSYSETKWYLIGKWGDVKQSFEELKVKAYNKYLKTEKTTLEERLSEVKVELQNVTIKAKRRFNY